MANEIHLIHGDGSQNVYAVIRNMAGLWWNGVLFTAFDDSDWGDYVIALTEVHAAADGNVAVQGTFPAIAAGWYWIDKYLRVNGPLYDDAIQESILFYWDETSLFPGASGLSAALAAIQAKTDTIGTVEMTAVSPTIVDDTFTIYAGDDYADADGRALTVTGVDASAFDLEASGVEVVFRLLKWTDYRQDDTTEAELEATATVDEVDGDGLATLSVELTAAQTDGLSTSPPQPEKNYAFQWIATLESGRTVLLASGRMTVVKRLTDAS